MIGVSFLAREASMARRKLYLLVVFLLFCLAGYGTASGEPLRVGVSGLSAEFTPVWAANERPIFKKYGFETEVIAMQGGTQLAQAIIGGSIPVGVMGGAYLTAAVRGADLVMIATHMDKFPYSLIVRADIKKVEDLKGTKLAISRFGSASDAALRVSLQKLGIVPDKDATILQVGGQTSRFAALKAGTVDGTVVIPPLSSAAQRLGYNVLINMTQLGIPYPQEGVVVRRQTLATRREMVTRFLKAYLEGVKEIKTDKEFAIAVMAKHLRMDPKKDRDALEDSFREVVTEQMLKVPLVNFEAVKVALELLGREIPPKASTNAADYVDGGLMQELAKSGFIENLYR
jgi:NitT/TauT family transport system substrate-binding protein